MKYSFCLQIANSALIGVILLAMAISMLHGVEPRFYTTSFDMDCAFFALQPTPRLHAGFAGKHYINVGPGACECERMCG